MNSRCLCSETEFQEVMFTCWSHRTPFYLSKIELYEVASKCPVVAWARKEYQMSVSVYHECCLFFLLGKRHSTVCPCQSHFVTFVSFVTVFIVDVLSLVFRHHDTVEKPVIQKLGRRWAFRADPSLIGSKTPNGNGTHTTNPQHVFTCLILSFWFWTIVFLYKLKILISQRAADAASFGHLRSASWDIQYALSFFYFTIPFQFPLKNHDVL